MTDAELIAHLAELEAKATPGEWERAGRSWAIAALLPDVAPDPVCIVDAQSGKEADFIVAMRNALPRLLELARDGLSPRTGVARLDTMWQQMVAERDALKEDVRGLEQARTADLQRIRDLEAANFRLVERTEFLQQKYYARNNEAAEFHIERDHLLAERTELLELVACTNRDGGHYHSEHGTHMAVQLGRDNFYGVSTERDRYLAALKAEAGKSAEEWGFQPCTENIGGITFRVTRNEDGTLSAEEIRE